MVCLLTDWTAYGVVGYRDRSAVMENGMGVVGYGVLRISGIANLEPLIL